MQGRVSYLVAIVTPVVHCLVEFIAFPQLAQGAFGWLLLLIAVCQRCC
jgi:hypothetical protein